MAWGAAPSGTGDHGCPLAHGADNAHFACDRAQLEAERFHLVELAQQMAKMQEERGRTSALVDRDRARLAAERSWTAAQAAQAASDRAQAAEVEESARACAAELAEERRLHAAQVSNDRKGAQYTQRTLMEQALALDEEKTRVWEQAHAKQEDVDMQRWKIDEEMANHRVAMAQERVATQTSERQAEQVFARAKRERAELHEERSFLHEQALRDRAELDADKQRHAALVSAGLNRVHVALEMEEQRHAEQVAVDRAKLQEEHNLFLSYFESERRRHEVQVVTTQKEHSLEVQELLRRCKELEVGMDHREAAFSFESSNFLEEEMEFQAQTARLESWKRQQLEEMDMERHHHDALVSAKSNYLLEEQLCLEEQKAELEAQQAHHSLRVARDVKQLQHAKVGNVTNDDRCDEQLKELHHAKKVLEKQLHDAWKHIMELQEGHQPMATNQDQDPMYHSKSDKDYWKALLYEELALIERQLGHLRKDREQWQPVADHSRWLDTEHQHSVPDYQISTPRQEQAQIELREFQEKLRAVRLEVDRLAEHMDSLRTCLQDPTEHVGVEQHIPEHIEMHDDLSIASDYRIRKELDRETELLKRKIGEIKSRQKTNNSSCS